MPRQKSLKTLFVETVMFVSVFALMGHLSVNFWERYVIQNELTKMKNSLHSLKDTINNIGVAYDHLHKELRGLAEIAEKQQPINLEKPERKIQSNLAQQILQNVHVQTAMGTNDINEDVKASAVEKNTQKHLYEYDIDKNVATHTAPFKGDKKIGPELIANSDKVVQHVGKHLHASVLADTKLHKIKNISTMTRYPLKSTAAGKGVSALDIHRNTRSNIHTCHEKDSKCENNFWKF